MRIHALRGNLHVAVIGGNGFVGRAIIHRLSGYKNLRIFSIDKRQHGVVIDTANSKAIISQIQADVSSADFIKTWLITHPVDVVIFAAGYENPTDGLGRSIDDTTALLGLNKTLQALQFMDLTKEEDKPYFLYLSSWAVYGKQGRKPVTEVAKEYPSNYVGLNKVLGEDLVRRYCSRANIPWAIVRPTEIYGRKNYKELQDSTFWHGYLNFYLDKIIKKEKEIEVWSPTTQVDLVNINYVTAVIRELIQNKVTGVYNIASGNVIKMLDLVKLLVECYGEAPHSLQIKTSKKLHIENMNLDCRKVTNLLPYPHDKYCLKNFIMDYIPIRRYEIGKSMAIEQALTEPVILDPTSKDALAEYQLRQDRRKLEYQTIKEIAGDEFFRIKIGHIQKRAQELLKLPDIDLNKLGSLQEFEESKKELALDDEN